MTAFEENKKTHMQVQRGMKKRGQRKRIAAVRWERRWVGREPPPPPERDPPEGVRDAQRAQTCGPG